MVVFSDPHHPSSGDTANGTTVWESDVEHIIFVQTWSGYSAEFGRFSAVMTSWRIDREAQTLTFRDLAMHTGDDINRWETEYANPFRLIPDSHKRLARAWAREEFGRKRFCDLII